MKRAVYGIVLLILIAGFFLLSTDAVREGDIFWHIKTGEWIWQNRTLPSHDAFTFTAQNPGMHTKNVALRYEIILKSYWLSQLLYSFIYIALGIPGIVLLRACILALILLVLAAWMHRMEVRFTLVVVILFLVGFWLRNMGDRPHYVSFLFFPLTAMVLEGLRDKLREPVQGGSGGAGILSRLLPGVLLLPLIMVLWANMHAGYVTGIALIGMYCAGESLSAIQNRERKDRARQLVIFTGVCLAAVAASMANPLTYKALLYVLAPETRNSIEQQVVIDYLSPITAIWKFGNYNPTYWVLLCIAVVVLAARLRRMDPTRVIALISFALLSLSAQRMIPFFMTLAPLAAAELDSMVSSRFRRTFAAAAFSCIAGLLALIPVEARYGKILNFSLEWAFPVHAVDFLSETRPQGNLFNFADWGGYIMMYLPGFKVFDDGRRLIPDIELAHYRMLRGEETLIAGVPEWKAYLNAYNIDIILVPSVTPLFGEFIFLVKELYRDNDFDPIYFDDNALIYLHKGMKNRALLEKYALPKEVPLLHAINRLIQSSVGSRDRDVKMRLVGDLYTLMGKQEAAREYYRLLDQR